MFPERFQSTTFLMQISLSDGHFLRTSGATNANLNTNIIISIQTFSLRFVMMVQKQDSAEIAKTGHTTIVASMIMFVVLVLIMWGLMGIQIHLQHKKRLADLENGDGEGVCVVDDDVPIDHILKTTRYSGAQPERKSKISLSSWSATATEISATTKSSKSGIPKDSQWYAEERPVRYFFHKMGNMFKR
ncbi:hypothetical protein GGR58DRAFT_495633 [Xylaria digitata]|nr:hypothetical protein GGR58DRAFT_495633 [Xylaria digitata]